MTANNVTKPTQLPHPRRFITTHDDDGKAVFSHQLHETVPFWPVGPKEEPAAFGLAYTTSTAPVRLAENYDLVAFANADRHRETSGLVQDGGTVLRYVDYSPRSSSPMHRTVSCDYAIVLMGEMACLLDSGESRILGVGDVVIQRGTMHQWMNNTDSWSRMLYVLIDATPIYINGRVLGEDLGDMEGVPKSKIVRD